MSLIPRVCLLLHNTQMQILTVKMHFCTHSLSRQIIYWKVILNSHNTPKWFPPSLFKFIWVNKCKIISCPMNLKSKGVTALLKKKVVCCQTTVAVIPLSLINEWSHLNDPHTWPWGIQQTLKCALSLNCICRLC